MFALFLGRAVLVGLLGGLLGYAAGTLVGVLWGEGPAAGAIEAAQLLAVVTAAPVLCGLASWVPALLAARQDPAVVLREG